MFSLVKEEPQFYELFKNISHGVLLEIINQISQTPVKTFLHHFEQKSIIFSDILLPRLDKNISIAMQKMTEKKQ